MTHHDGSEFKVNCKSCLLPSPAWFSIAVLLLVFGCRQGNEISKAGVYLNDALAAIDAGENDRAIELLSKSLELEPEPYAYFQRAKLFLQLDNAASANADITKGLALEPEHPDLVWLQEQARIPTERRFKGAEAEPPSYGK